MTPHKHADILKALADGHEIEWKYRTESENAWTPLMPDGPVGRLILSADSLEYRIKPEKKWYRVAELKESCFVKGSLIIIRTEESEKAVDPSTPGSMVKRWITDRIYYE